jgi:hypothetical protein
MKRLLPAALAGAIYVGLMPLHAEAQSLLSAGGLGVPVEPLDARARGMGSIGTGLFGSHLIPTDPASALGLTLPTITASLQPSTGTVEQGGTSVSSAGSRFPLLAVGYPVQGRGVVTVTFGSYLDQRWRAETPGTLDLAGEEVSITDHFDSDGGIAAVRVGWAQRVGGHVTVGVTGGLYTGQLRRTFVREYDGLSTGTVVEPTVVTGDWRMSAPTVGIGAQWDFQDFFRLAGSVNWAGTLEAERTDGEVAETREFDLPTEFRVGASAVLTPRLAFTAGAGYADWTAAGEALDGGSARAIWSIGVGSEWDGPRIGARNVPIRLGYRRADLPFRFEASDPTETLFAGGFGINFAQVENIPLARLDLSFERGSRTAGPLSESFWRTTLSLRLSGG